MVHPPHEDAEKGVAGPEQLDFLGHEVLLLGLGLAGHHSHDVAWGGHGCWRKRRMEEEDGGGRPGSAAPGPGKGGDTPGTAGLWVATSGADAGLC